MGFAWEAIVWYDDDDDGFYDDDDDQDDDDDDDRFYIALFSFPGQTHCARKRFYMSDQLFIALFSGITKDSDRQLTHWLQDSSLGKKERCRDRFATSFIQPLP